MISKKNIDEIARSLRKKISARIVSSGNAIGIGLEMASGRAVGCYVDTTVLDAFRVSDGGDAWNDLVAEGYSDPTPSAADREKLVRACELHGVRWDSSRREIFALAHTTSEVADAARRIATASIAIDGWRAWYPPRTTAALTTNRIVRHVSRLAPHRGWVVDADTRFATGKIHRWPIAARLTRRSTDAFLRVTQEPIAERVIEMTIGFLHDVSDGGVVLVVPSRVARFVDKSREFDRRVAVVARQAKGTPRAVIEGAERAVA